MPNTNVVQREHQRPTEPNVLPFLRPAKESLRQPYTLIFGRDSSLLERQKLILATAGIVCFTAQTFGEVLSIISTRQIRLLVLCHTVPDEECRTAVFVARYAQTDLRVIFLATKSRQPPAESGDLVLPVHLGSGALVETVWQMLKAIEASLEQQMTPSPARMHRAPLDKL